MADIRKFPQRKKGGERSMVANLECFDEGGKFVPAWAGDLLTRECRIVLGHDRRLWRYVDGVYRPDGDDWARARLKTLVGERFRRNQLEEVSVFLRAQLPTLGHTPVTEVINCQNGLLDWATGTLKPHSAAVLTTNQIPMRWDPNATAPTIARFLADVFPSDAIGLIEELVGYAMYAGNPFRKAAMLLGTGANGKSTFLRLLTALLGEANVSSVPLQALSENRFAAADVYGKLANICGDLDARAIQRTDCFKQITGGDPIMAERKFRDAFSFVAYALPLFSANEPPRTADQTNAWFDRWIILPMERRFAGADEDTSLPEKLATELEGLLVLAVRGLQRLMARRRFEFPPSVERARARYRQMLDTVRAFVSERCHLAAAAWADRADLYESYRDWCQRGGRFSLASHTFNAHLVQAYPMVGPRKRQGRPGWLGLAMGPDPLAGDEGDEGDDFSTSSYRHARGELGKVEIASPSSPSSPRGREPGEEG